MKITYKGDYALKAILDLSYHFNDGVVSLTDIAARQNIPTRYLEQIMLVLKGAGYVDSKRGIGGGFFLLKPPGKITIGEILRLIEGPVEPISCAKRRHDGSCGDEETCAFREIWLEISDVITHQVDNITFSDMKKRTSELKQQKTGYMFHI
ncbi:Rrf2 family transcriptional regulator [candidate division KSB1 bacterium]|nr:Rrf2 family transcriptional regulator [candidate division KSB1 bacterium]